MYWFALFLILTVALAVALTLVGRALALAMRIDALDGDQPEHWLGCMLFGAGMVTLLSGWCSFSGLGARDYRWIVLAAIAALISTVVVRGDFRRLFRFGRAPGWHLAIWAILILRVGLYLLPVAHNGSHSFFSDALIYVPAADWLTQNGFGMSVERVREEPVRQMIMSLHELNHHMGPIFLLSLVSAIVPDLGAFELFSVAMALAIMLNVGALYLICRWCFLIPQPLAVLGLLLMAALVHTLGLSSSGTFFAQVYGTAVLGTAIAVMAVLCDSRRWTPGNAMLVGSLLAFQMSMYSEFIPVVALVGCWWLVIVARIAKREKCLTRLMRFLLTSFGLSLLLSNIDIIRAWQLVHSFVKLDGVGYRVPWTWAEFLEFALGGRGFDFLIGPPIQGWQRVLCSATMSLLLVVGIRELFRNGGVFVAAALAVLAGLSIYFACFRTDPWTGEVGHTWNLFKIAKWAYPFIAAVQLAGAARLLGLGLRWRILGAVAVALLVGCAYCNIQHHRKVARLSGQFAFHFARQESPYSALGRLRARLKELDGPIFVVRPPRPVPDGPLLVSLLYPHSLVNTWHSDPHYGRAWLLEECPHAYQSKTIYLQLGVPPFEAPLEQLPFNISRLDPERPTLFRIDNPDQPIAFSVPCQVLRIGPNPATCWIFATRDGSAAMSFEWGEEPQAPDNALTIGTDDGPQVVTIQSSKGLPQRISLKRGVNRVTLTPSGNEIIAITGIKIRWEDGRD